MESSRWRMTLTKPALGEAWGVAGIFTFVSALTAVFVLAAWLLSGAEVRSKHPSTGRRRSWQIRL